MEKNRTIQTEVPILTKKYLKKILYEALHIVSHADKNSKKSVGYAHVCCVKRHAILALCMKITLNCDYVISVQFIRNSSAKICSIII